MIDVRPLLLPALLPLTAACAGSATLAPPAPSELPRLEASVAADPGDVDSGLRLATGYRDAGRIEEARSLVDRLLEVAPDDPGLAVMAGLLAEDAGDLVEARRLYQAVLDAGRGGDLLGEVERRLDAVRRLELRERVVDALEREEEVADSDPDPAAVGVFPFLFEGDDPDMEPLALAIPEMLSTDLAVTGRLRVVERLHVQALLDELALAESGRVDPASGARGGRLLGSGNIVQGRLRLQEGARIGVEAAVVEVGAGDEPTVDPLSDEDAVDQVFALEKRLALDLHAELGIELTPAERERITERQTESVQALLAFGRGIAAENAGSYEEAQAHYEEASSHDPGFALARNRAERLGRIAGVAARLTTDVRAFAHRIATQRHAVDLLRSSPSALRDRLLQSLTPRQRAVMAEVLGQDRIGQLIQLELVFVLPGGQQ